MLKYLGYRFVFFFGGGGGGGYYSDHEIIVINGDVCSRMGHLNDSICFIFDDWWIFIHWL